MGENRKPEGELSAFAIANSAASHAEIDDLDRQILSVLAVNARSSARAIARALGVSASMVLERIARLEKRKVILGYRVEVDPAAAGYGMMVFIAAQIRGEQDIDDVFEALSRIDEVQVVNVVTGTFDILITVLLKDMSEFQDVVLKKIRVLPGFLRSESMIGVRHMRRIGGRFAFVWTADSPGIRDALKQDDDAEEESQCT
jgi:Lrp/AsnC family transcriptional regulator, leucine-responsive regulatory protein